MELDPKIGALGAYQYPCFSSRRCRLGYGKNGNESSRLFDDPHLVNGIGQGIVIIRNQLIGDRVMRFQILGRQRDLPLGMAVASFKDLAGVDDLTVETNTKFGPFLTAQKLSQPLKFRIGGSSFVEGRKQVLTGSRQKRLFHVAFAPISLSFHKNADVRRILGNLKGLAQAQPRVASLGKRQQNAAVGRIAHRTGIHPLVTEANVDPHLQISTFRKGEILCTDRNTALPRRGNICHFQIGQHGWPWNFFIHPF